MSRTPKTRLLLPVVLAAACGSVAPPPVSLPVAPAESPAARPRTTEAPRDEPVAPRLTPDAPFRFARPPAGPARPFSLPPVKRFRLPNGLPVILAESHKFPLVGFELVIKTGSAANPRGQPGLAALVADLLDEGTKTRNALAIADEVAHLGASLDTHAGWDASSVSVSSLSEKMDQALAVWADVIMNPSFDDQELARVRAHRLSTLRRRKDSPPAVAALTFARVVYGEGHPYGWPLDGTEESVPRIEVADLRRFWETYYRPNNAVLVVAGDVTEQEVRTKVTALLAGWKRRPVPAARLPKPTPPSRTRVFLVDKAGAPQSSIRIGLVGIERKNPDYHEAVVMNHILGGSFRRLALNLREAKGWTYGVGSLFEARRTRGPWTVGGEFVAAHTAPSVREILREVRALREEEVSDQELRETKDEIIKAFPARFATTNQIAGQMATLAVYDLPPSELASYARQIAAVTKADVRRVARKLLDPERMAIVVVGDQKTHEAALREIAELELRDLDGNAINTTAASQ